MFDTFSCSANGGAFYLGSISNSLTLRTGMIINKATAAKGAVVYTGTTATSNTLVVNAVTLTTLTATSKGSFIYVEGDASPTITFTLTSSSWTC